MLNNRYLKGIFTIFLIILIIQISFSQDATNDKKRTGVNKRAALIIDEYYEPDEEDLKELPLTFNMGGSLFLTSRIMFKTFQTPQSGGFEPVPADEWYADADGKIWMKMNIKDDSFVHLGFRVLFKFEENSIVPMFNIDDLYLQWKYSIGKIVFGRSVFNLKSAFIFKGPLDGLELDINVPYLDFKTFVGFTGLLGIFNPWFNPYVLSSQDTSYYEDTNLLFGYMLIKFNAEQARRMFFATDFDIHFFGQHVNPYFLMQYDLQSLFNNLDIDKDVHTFHVGINFEGRIIQNLYYKVHFSGLFGTYPSSTSGVSTPILGCALETNLRYTIAKAGYSTFLVGYALGTGNEERVGSWSSYSKDSDKGFDSEKYDGKYNNKFYYFGKFDGGYVLKPVLSNLQVISIKYFVSPVKRAGVHWTIYMGFYQTFKIWNTGPISDELSDIECPIVGSEIDVGMIVNAGPYFTLGLDFGIFIPELAYSNRDPRFRMGTSLGFTF